MFKKRIKDIVQIHLYIISLKTGHFKSNITHYNYDHAACLKHCNIWITEGLKKGDRGDPRKKNQTNTHLKLNCLPLKGYRAPIGKDRLPNHFFFRCYVSFRECKWNLCIMVQQQNQTSKTLISQISFGAFTHFVSGGLDKPPSYNHDIHPLNPPPFPPGGAGGAGGRGGGGTFLNNTQGFVGVDS